MYIRRLVFTSSPTMDPEDEEPSSPRSGSRRGLKFEEAAGDEYFDLGHHREERAGDGWVMADSNENGSKAINGRKDLWAAPLGRESKLEVVKSGSLYDIRAYKGEMKPSRLYGEDEEELRYRIRPEEASPEKAEELEEERREIIRSQVVRKSTTMAEKWSSAEELEDINASSAGREAAPGTRSYSTGFAVCFDSPSSRWESTPVDPQNIDTEKINFAMARQQFLELEKTNPKLLLGPRKPAPSSRTTQNIQGTEAEQIQEQIPDVYGQRRVGWSSERAESRVPQRTEPTCPKQAPICQNSDYGLAEMPQNTNVVAPDGRRVYIKEELGEPLDWEAGGQGLAEEDLGSSDETPIEREIRLSMEREDAHRKERGIHRVDSRDELVEIQTKPLLLSADTPPASSRKGKDKHGVSFFVQREIEQETRREEDLQKEGRLSGTYDRGVCREISERRKVFERDEEAPMTARMLGEREEARNGDPGKRTAGQDVKWSSEAYQPSLPSRRKQRGDSPPFDQNDTVFGQRVDSSGARVLGDSEPAILREGHFAIPVRKLRFSSPVDREPLTSRRKEGSPEWAAPREELYTVKTQRPRMSALIDQEIRDALQREVELQEQRRRAGTATGSKAPSRTSSQSSAASGISDSYCVSAAAAPDSPARSSPSASPRQAYAGRPSSERPSAEEEKTKRHREGGKYAGIDLHDEIDSEVVKSTKVVCQRGLLAQLWETGQIRGAGDDSD
ncbi:mitotic interactor and substrate of PLK1 [Lacerta agilis]|uniref:mitotic interactor and substrate of PLK1 n=1 Tax=Lacerta agilis TaxID=80427 RepID=UPI0014194FA7|nr:mitotic interactor and substrate of PLK1 [Lacerta agilis]